MPHIRSIARASIVPGWLGRIGLAATLGAMTAGASATDIARVPLGVVPQPNLIFGMDDSASMDYEVLLSGTIDGALFWDPQRATGWSAAGVPLFGVGMPSFGYLFPNGCDWSHGGRFFCDAAEGHWAIAPTAQLAPLRSNAWNPLYYDPLRRYDPWMPGYASGVLHTWGNVDPHAAPENPLFPVTRPLDTGFTSATANFTFRMLGGMIVPAGASTRDPASGAWTVVGAAFTIPAGSAYDVSMTYYPATYWVTATCGVNGIDCAAAPDGTTLRRYEIRPGATFPSGRSYEAELQNFANWFTYHRRRRWMLAASMGRAMSGVSGIRVGVVDFNNHQPVTMVDTDSADPAANGAVITGHFQRNGASGTTPTRSTLAYIGEQYRTNPAIVTSSCQPNAAVIVTDGYATLAPFTPPPYAAALYGAAAPYATTWANTLADIALSYYTNNLRPDLPAGRLPATAPGAVNPDGDRNPNLHMTTSAITLGAVGEIWPARGSPWKGSAIAWPNPDVTLSPKAIDDLWHATINGRGRMLLARNPDDTAAALRTVVADARSPRAAQSGVAFGRPSLSAGDAVAVVGSYRPANWSGDVQAHAVDPLTGVISNAALWSADALLNAADWRQRVVFGFDGATGVPFTAAAVGSRLVPGQPAAAASSLVDYLLGDRSREGTTFRTRGGRLGADLDAEPVVDRLAAVVYAVTNDGMVHAFDKATGQELWAYVPGFALADIAAESRPDWIARTVLDATPVLATAGARRMLVGGRGSAGAGFYALDVGQPRGLAAAGRATSAMWEFPNATSASAQSTTAQIAGSVGVSMGKPLIVDSATYGWVVLVTSGYNTARDGKGRLFVLDAATGAVRVEIVTPAGSPGAGDAGLAQVSGFAEAGGSVRFVYGGDLLGNLWRFDIDAGSVQRLALLQDAQGTPLPVTAAPELSNVGGRRMVYVGTGRLLGNSDLEDARVNTVFAIADDGSPGADLRPLLATRVLTDDGAARHVSGAAVDWSRQRGWAVDLPAGEKANTDPTLALGMLSWTTNRASLAACSSGSVLYVAAAASGLDLPATSFPGAAWYGVTMTSTLASRATLARLVDGSFVDATQQSDGSLTQHRLLAPGPAVPRKDGWREIRR